MIAVCDHAPKYKFERGRPGTAAPAIIFRIKFVFTPLPNIPYSIALNGAMTDPINSAIMYAQTGIVVPSRILATRPSTKAKIKIDTTNVDGVRNITASVMKLENGNWIPAADVEMKLGVLRMDKRILSGGDEATYTTDSTGMVTVEFKRDNLPGDIKGNIVLAASVEDNEEFGNLLIEKPVKWGVSVKEDKSFFDQRALWKNRSKTPYWLLIMAYSIAAGVWVTILYLVFQLFKIKKLGV